MKYALLILLFISGVLVGRWSVSGNVPSVIVKHVPQIVQDKQVETIEAKKLEASSIKTLPKKSRVENFLNIQKDSDEVEAGSESDQQMATHFAKLMKAIKNENMEEQNQIVAEMEKLDPKHELVFKAKATLLQEDNDWEGAHQVLVECAEAIPNSKFCLERLTNIRTSTNEEKIKYGEECLKLDKRSPFCSLDLAVAYSSIGNFQRAKVLFENALPSFPKHISGSFRGYVLLQYALTLQNLQMSEEASRTLMEACEAESAEACEKVKKKG